MSRNRLFLISGALAVAAIASLIFGITLLNKNIASYIAEPLSRVLPRRERNALRLQRIARGGGRHARQLSSEPEARAANGNNEYLRYSNNIVIVGPEGNYPCSIRVEPLSAGYNHGAFIFLGPGFTPGSPAGGAGGTPGGPGGRVK